MQRWVNYSFSMAAWCVCLCVWVRVCQKASRCKADIPPCEVMSRRREPGLLFLFHLLETSFRPLVSSIWAVHMCPVYHSRDVFISSKLKAFESLVRFQREGGPARPRFVIDKKGSNSLRQNLQGCWLIIDQPSSGRTASSIICWLFW